MIDDTDLAYAAGYTDGDGCFHIGKIHSENRIRYRAIFVINSTEIENVQWFQKIFGGTISSKNPKKSNHKIIYRYVLKGNLLNNFEKICPYIKEKLEELQIFYSFVRQEWDRDDLIEDMKIVKSKSNLVKEVGKTIKDFKQQIIPTSEMFAYLAGFVDAECCLNIQKYSSKKRPNPIYKIQLQCNNTKWPALLWIVIRFGGQLHYIDRSKYKNNKDQIAWRLSSKALYPVLQGILPFLKHKKPVCEELIKLYKTTLSIKNCGAPSPNSPQFAEFYAPTLIEKEQIFHKVQSLNKKGI